MFKKRQVAGIQQRRRILSELKTKVETGEEELHEEPDISPDVHEKIKNTKERHRLRQRPKGLSATSIDNLEIKVEGRRQSQQVELQDEAQKFHLLAKSFRQQGDKAESSSKTDSQLEEFLISSMKESTGEVAQELEHPITAVDTTLENQLYEIPEHLQVPDIAQVEKNKLSWVSGLTEVSIGKEEKLKNIEETERLKRKAVGNSGNTDPAKRTVDYKRHKRS